MPLLSLRLLLPIHHTLPWSRLLSRLLLTRRDPPGRPSLSTSAPTTRLMPPRPPLGSDWLSRRWLSLRLLLLLLPLERRELAPSSLPPKSPKLRSLPRLRSQQRRLLRNLLPKRPLRSLLLRRLLPKSQQLRSLLPRNLLPRRLLPRRSKSSS